MSDELFPKSFALHVNLSYDELKDRGAKKYNVTGQDLFQSIPVNARGHMWQHRDQCAAPVKQNNGVHQDKASVPIFVLIIMLWKCDLKLLLL